MFNTTIIIQPPHIVIGCIESMTIKTETKEPSILLFYYLILFYYFFLTSLSMQPDNKIPWLVTAILETTFLNFFFLFLFFFLIYY